MQAILRNQVAHLFKAFVRTHNVASDRCIEWSKAQDSKSPQTIIIMEWAVYLVNPVFHFSRDLVFA